MLGGLVEAIIYFNPAKKSSSQYKELRASSYVLLQSITAILNRFNDLDLVFNESNFEHNVKEKINVILT